MKVEKPVAPDVAFEEFRRWIRRSRYADTSQKVYVAKAEQFLEWLTASGSEYADALSDEHVRDWAVRDYRRHLMTEKRQAVATVELAMASIGVFFTHLGLGKPDVRRQRPTPSAPKSLTDDQFRRFMREAERRGAREWAIVNTLYSGCCRVAEAASLNLDDVLVSDRTGIIHIRSGKGDKYREVPISEDTRSALRPWLAIRFDQTRGQDRVGEPLFTGRQPGRLSCRRLQSLVADIGGEVGVDVSPHDLRHTYGFHYLRDNPGDLVGLQELYGHADVKTTAGYARPTAEAKRAAVERVRIDL